MERGGRKTSPLSLAPWLEADRRPLPDPEPLRAFDLLNPARAAGVLQRLSRGPQAGVWRSSARNLAAALIASPDPDLALSTLERLSDVTDLRATADDPDRLAALLRILGSSVFLGDLLVRMPHRLEWLFARSGLQKRADEGVASLRAEPWGEIGGEEELLETLNLRKRTELLRLGARSVLGLSTLEEEFEALSLLAETILDTVLERLWPQHLPSPAVLGLGKLGGGELNFSSDIDLIFVLHLEEVPLHAHLPAAGRAVEELVKALTRYTAEGALYRVDLRLRPGGERAPLVRTVRGMENHYASRGASWERQMLVKARVCAGNREAGNTLLRRLEPFIYPSHAGQDPQEEAHRHRRERRAREGSALTTDHVKLAPGGIRDVEFVVQILQLLYGGRRPEVRATGTLPALEKLRRYGILPDEEAAGLEDAYRFFRRLEHLIQMEEDRQTFLIPEAAGRRRAFARLMGFEGTEAFIGAYHRHRGRVEATLRSLLPGIGEERTGEPVESLLNLHPGGAEAAERLRRRGFRRPEQSHRVLIATGSAARAEGPNAWAAFVGLLPPLLQDAVATGAPDRALNNLERLLRRLGSTGSYARLLAREAALRRALLHLCASGELLSDLLIRHPEHFERLFSAGAASFAADPGGWRRRLRAERRQAAGGAVLARRLESLRTRETLATGLAYALGERSLEATMHDLGTVARDLLRLFLGAHLHAFLRPPAVGVLSLGTLAACSMSFASDADLLFVHTEEAGSEVQPLVARAAGLLSPPGGPYPVDMRLRPEGRSAPPSVDIHYLRSYLAERASAWEALAMARARPLYGRMRVVRSALEVIEEWLASFRLDDAARTELRRVRRLQEEEAFEDAAGGSSSFFDVKRSPGAMADVEFLAIGLALDDWERGRPRHAHIPDLLASLASSGRLRKREAAFLGEAYQRMRRVQVGLQLHYGRDASRLPADWGESLPSPPLAGETVDALEAVAERVRAIFDREFPA